MDLFVYKQSHARYKVFRDIFDMIFRHFKIEFIFYRSTILFYSILFFKNQKFPNERPSIT